MSRRTPACRARRSRWCCGKARWSPLRPASGSRGDLGVGYVYNRGAARLRTGLSGTIGVIVPEITNPFYAELTAGIDETLDAAGRLAFLANSNESPQRQERFIRRIKEQGVDGIILCAAVGTSPALIAQLKAWRMPLRADPAHRRWRRKRFRRPGFRRGIAAVGRAPRGPAPHPHRPACRAARRPRRRGTASRRSLAAMRQHGLRPRPYPGLRVVTGRRSGRGGPLAGRGPAADGLRVPQRPDGARGGRRTDATGTETRRHPVGHRLRRHSRGLPRGSAPQHGRDAVRTKSAAGPQNCCCAGSLRRNPATSASSSSRADRARDMSVRRTMADLDRDRLSRQRQDHADHRAAAAPRDGRHGGDRERVRRDRARSSPDPAGDGHVMSAAERVSVLHGPAGRRPDPARPAPVLARGRDPRFRARSGRNHGPRRAFAPASRR